MVVSKSLLALLFCCMVFTLILKSSMGRPQEEEGDSQSDEGDDAVNENDDQPDEDTDSADEGDFYEDDGDAAEEGDEQPGGNANSGDENSDNAGTAQQTEEEDNKPASRIDTGGKPSPSRKKPPTGNSKAPANPKRGGDERCGKCGEGMTCPIGEDCQEKYLYCIGPKNNRGERTCPTKRVYSIIGHSCVSLETCDENRTSAKNRKKSG